MVVELIQALRDRVFLGALPEQDSRPYLLGPQRRPNPLEPALFDQGDDRLLDQAPFDRTGVRIGRRPLVEELRVLERIFMRQGERLDGEARMGKQSWKFLKEWEKVSGCRQAGGGRGLSAGAARERVARKAPPSY